MSDESLFGLGPQKLDSVFSIVTQRTDTSSDQKSGQLLAELLHKWLQSNVCKDSPLLGEVFDTLQHLKYNVDSLVNKSMREILLDPDSDITVLGALSDHSERLSSSTKSEAESTIAVIIHFAIRASLLVYHDKALDDFSKDDLSESFGDIFAKKWIPADLKGLFWQARKICHAKQVGQSSVDMPDSDSKLDKDGTRFPDKDAVSPALKATDVLLEKPGTHIGRYRLLSILGEGGMGVVYLAEQERPIRRQVALKIIKPGMDSKRAIEHFETERQTLALLDHPNIAHVFDADTTADGRLYFVMEHVKGLPVTQHCEQYELTIEERLSLFLQVCHALQHAHQKGIIHRDIKPSNILISLQEDQAIPRIIDFGVAKAVSRSLKGMLDPVHGQVTGTPGYMSPEQASAEPVDQRTDIWSFGCVLFEMLAGASPFPFQSKSEAIEMALNAEPAWETLPTEIRPDLRGILEKCLKENPDERYQSASALYDDLRKCYDALIAPAPKPFDPGALLQTLRKPHNAICALLAVLLLSAGIVWLVNRTLKARWVRTELLPQIIELVKSEQYSQAFVLAGQAEKYIPNNPLLIKLWPEMSAKASITTTPPGARIFLTDYRTLGEEWDEPIGQSPLEDIRIPFGIYRVKVSKAGFETRELIARVYDRDTWKLETQLYELGSLPLDMVSIPELLHWGKTGLPAYFLDKYEVTNAQFKRFVDEGGYENPAYWRKCKFVDDGREISWEEAVKRFRDKSGQPGPAMWEERTFPAGQENHPVSGVSWFEAVAYAEFVGKAIPTERHWTIAASPWESQIIIEFSNFKLEGTKPVGSSKAITSTGVYDMAGNVKEWCWNATDDSESYRYLRGGSWSEPTYTFNFPDSQSAWAREPTIGFRCVFYPEAEESIPSTFFDPIERRAIRDFNDFQPVSNDVFASWMTDLYEFDRGDVNSVLDSVDDSSPYWRKEKILFDAAYDNEQIISYLFLPKGTKPPYQSIVYFPGIGVFNDFSSDLLGDFYPVSLLVKSGRAVLYPIYKGSYERYDKQKPFQLSDKLVVLEYCIKWTKDVRRSVDYLQTREDIDMNKLTYCGWSSGEGFGPIALAVEDRIKFGIFMHGGLWIEDEFPAAAEPANFAPRVKVPVLKVNGREDFTFPLKLSQEPMYRLLGSVDKKHILHPGGHTLFALLSKEIRDEMFTWIDEHLGPIK
jgi:serine/threonine protein kinase